jgi:hypothetical protein
MSQETQVEASAPDAIPTSPIFASAKKEFKFLQQPSTSQQHLSAETNGEQ